MRAMKGDVGSPRLNTAEMCAQAMADAGDPRPMSAEQ